MLHSMGMGIYSDSRILKINTIDKIAIINTVENTLTGMFLSMIVTHYYMFYRLGVHFDWANNMELTVICTLVSLLRGYIFAKMLASKLKTVYGKENKVE